MSLIQNPTVSFNPANQSAFGSLETNELTPVLQGDFVYGLNTQIWQTAATSGTGAAVDINAARLRIQSGTAATTYAYQLTRKPIKYRAGQGITLRMTPLYTTGQANSLQLWGAGAVASNAPYDGYFFGYNGADFGIAYYNASSLTFTTQANWNGPGLGFSYDPTKGTPAMIKYPYLGYGNISFWLQNPDTSAWMLAHTIEYANSSASVQLSNPTLYFLGFAANSGNTSNLIMYCGSYGAFVSGPRSYVGNPRWSYENDKSGITTETNIVSIKNATTYNGVSNRGLIRLTGISVSSSAANGVTNIKIKIGVTLGGSPSYATISGTTADGGATITSGNSIASVDVAGTTVTGGTFIRSYTVENPGGYYVDLTGDELFIAPGELATFSGESGTSSQIGVSVNWSEDI